MKADHWCEIQRHPIGRLARIPIRRTGHQGLAVRDGFQVEHHEQNREHDEHAKRVGNRQ